MCPIMFSGITSLAVTGLRLALRLCLTQCTFSPSKLENCSTHCNVRMKCIFRHCSTQNLTGFLYILFLWGYFTVFFQNKIIFQDVIKSAFNQIKSQVRHCHFSITVPPNTT
ncbi:hypothetical protein COCON_G00217590 [Conger conger]|uniref:Uncharacterized protein n=1 Tax=Conger conger TaxID=82655 RepID=A0A9Q1CXW2_CONCO|nr:hypothetical protein COCON_G00217590 [Conger conger]